VCFGWSNLESPEGFKKLFSKTYQPFVKTAKQTGGLLINFVSKN
jgi:hypothetical protein